MPISRRQTLANIALAGSALFLPAAAWAQTPISGSYVGTLDVGPGQLRLRLVLEGPTKNTLYSLDQGNAAIPASESSIQGDRLTLTFPGIDARYEARIAGPDRLEGTFTQGGQSFPLNFVRGEAKEEAPVDTGPLSQQLLDEYRQRLGTMGMTAAWAKGKAAPTILVSGKRSADAPQAATARDKWHLGSITKSMTATMIGRLVEAGKLRWESSVAEILGARVPEMNPAYRDITLLHLLSHRSGMPGNIDLARFEEFSRPPLDDARQERFKFCTLALNMAPEAKPGERLIYSNNGFVVAGTMAEVATGQSWEQLMRDQLFAPLKLQGAGFGPPDSAGKNDHPSGHIVAPGGKREATRLDNPAALGPAGLVHMPMADLLRYLEAHRDRPAAFLSADNWKRLHTPPFGGDYALGWSASPNGRLWHNGSNGSWFAEVTVDPASGAVAAFAANDAASARGGSSPMLKAALLAASGN